MAWKQPKVNWKVKYSPSGDYEGDFFNVEDYNRIVDNLEEIRLLAKTKYTNPNLDNLPVLSHKTYKDNINNLEARDILIKLNMINRLTVNIDGYRVFVEGIENDKAKFFNADDLNHIEQSTLNLYNQFIK